MPKLPSLSPKKVIKILEKKGFGSIVSYSESNCSYFLGLLIAKHVFEDIEHFIFL